MVPYTSVVGARSLVYGLQVFREATPQLRLLHLDGSVLYYDRRGGPRPPPMNRRRAPLVLAQYEPRMNQNLLMTSAKKD